MDRILDGILIGHWTDLDVATGLTTFLLPEKAVVAAAARGQNAGTMNIPIFEPQGAADHASAIVLTGGSVYGLAAAAHSMICLGERGQGIETAGGPVPEVLAAVVFDLAVGRRGWPDAASVESSINSAVPAGEEETGTVGVGTGVCVGSIAGVEHATKGGFGRAHRLTAQGATVAAWAAVNPVGDVIGEDGRVLAGYRDGDRFAGATEAIANDPNPALQWGRATTLVVVATDAALDKRATWRLAQAGHSGIAHTISPCATGLDGDTAFGVSTGEVQVRSVLALEAVAADVVAAAIRHAVRSATGLAGVPAIGELKGAH